MGCIRAHAPFITPYCMHRNGRLHHGRCHVFISSSVPLLLPSTPHSPHLVRAQFAAPAFAALDPFTSVCDTSGPKLTICRALSISSHSSRFDAIPQLEAMQLRSTRNESYTASWIGSIAWPVVRFKPTMLPSVCSSCSSATSTGSQ